MDYSYMILITTPSILVKQTNKPSTQRNNLHFAVCYESLNKLVAARVKIFGLVQDFFFCRQFSDLSLDCSSGAVLWSSRLLRLTASCNLTSLSWGVFTSIATSNLGITYSQTAAG